MAGTVGDEHNQFLCPLPRWAYPEDSPCAHSDDFRIGENDPAINKADAARARNGVQTIKAGLPWLFYLGLIAGGVYLAIRATETFLRLRESWYRVPGS